MLIIAAEAKLAGRVRRNPPMLVLSTLEHMIYSGNGTSGMINAGVTG
jgi:hypothetical protein